MNWPKDARAQEVAQSFISCNPFFTILINPNNLLEKQLVGGSNTIFSTLIHLCSAAYIHIIYVML